MPLFYVYKEKWNEYGEHRGVIVLAKNWQHTKGIAMAQTTWSDQSRNNIKVEEINISEGIVCNTNYTLNDITCN